VSGIFNILSPPELIAIFSTFQSQPFKFAHPMDADIRLQNFRQAYVLLANRTRASLTAHAQNPQVLQILRDDVLQFVAAAEPVCLLKDPFRRNN
jgi:hypothetical protein